MLSDTALITAAKSASSLRTLTPALGRTDEPDTLVACTHPLVELKSTKPRSLEGAVRVCAYCGERMNVADILCAITAKLSAHIKDDAAIQEIRDLVIAYRRAS